MRQMLMMILHCLYIHISIQKEIYITHVSKKNLNYLKESVVWNQYSNKDRLRTRSGVQFQKWFIVYMQKSVPWSLKSPSASCSHELPLGLFSMLSFWFFFFWFIFLVAFYGIFLSTDTFSCDRHKQRGWRSSLRQIILIFEMCSLENRDPSDLNGMDCLYQYQPEREGFQFRNSAAYKAD